MTTVLLPLHERKIESNNNPMYDLEDGYSHINIWQESRCPLGRMLSRFYEMPFRHPYFGPFNSMEGFWHYIKTKERSDDLRTAKPLEAKRIGKASTRLYVPNFEEIIKDANFHKIDQNPNLRALFVASTLPFDHYLTHGVDKIVIRSRGFEWMIDMFEDLRRLMKDGKAPPVPDYRRAKP